MSGYAQAVANQNITKVVQTGNKITVSEDGGQWGEFPSDNPAQGTHEWVALDINTGEKDITKVTFNGTLLTQDDVDEFTTEGGFTSADYSISGNTITLTDSGLDKFLSIMSEEMSEELGEEMGGAITYLAAYDNEIVMYLNDMLFTFYGSLLEEDTDYIIDGKIIVLTDAGYAKVTNLPGEN